jgi:hypothetical protein
VISERGVAEVQPRLDGRDLVLLEAEEDYLVCEGVKGHGVRVKTEGLSKYAELFTRRFRVVPVAALVLLLSALWPIYVFHSWLDDRLPDNSIAVATVLLGLVAATLAFAERHRIRSAVENPLLLLAPWGVGLLAVVTSLPLDNLAAKRLALFFLVAVPCFYTALVSPRLTFWLAAAALPLALVILVTGEPPADLNPIAAGWAALLVALLLVGERLTLVHLLAGFYVITILILGQLGPIIALTVGALFALLLAVKPAAHVARRATARPLPLLAAAGLTWVALMVVLTQSEPELADNHDTVAVRSDSLLAVMDSRSPLGHGVSAFARSDVGEFYGEHYPLNYIAEAFYTGGVLVLALMLILTVMAVRNTIRAGEVPRAAYVGLLVASLFSSGLYENYFLWFALGAMLRTSAPRSS